MRENLISIYHEFKGKLVGTNGLKTYVCETLSLMPPAIISRITTNCWFIGSMTHAWAFTFTGNDLRNQHLIFLSDDLLAQDSQQVYYSIAHEIGHVILGHRNSVLQRQTKQEVRRQEKEADGFAKQFVGL